MSPITKEQLRERARAKVKSLEFSITQTAFADSRSELEEELELARIALASLEAEAVGEVVLGEYDDCGCHPDAKVVCIAADGQADWGNFKDGTPLYTAPPAPASVPAAMEMDDDFDSAFEHGKAVGWNAYRAAMLQGSLVDFVDWQSKRIAGLEAREVVLPSTQDVHPLGPQSAKIFCEFHRSIVNRCADEIRKVGVKVSIKGN